MTDFGSPAADYLATRRAMGYTLTYQGQLLGQFVDYLEGVGVEHLTITHALSWAKQPSDAAPVWWAVKLGMVRGFARYLSAFDPATEVPPVGLLPEPNHRIVPYIYSSQDIAWLLKAAGRLHPEHRADTYQSLIALVAVTGMRVGEAVRLDRDDVDCPVDCPVWPRSARSRLNASELTEWRTPCTSARAAASASSASAGARTAIFFSPIWVSAVHASIAMSHYC
jgi:integrase